MNAIFSDKWDERTYAEADGVKLTKASIVRTYRGDLEGRALVEFLMVYCIDGSVTFTGLERFEGRVLGKAGTFVIYSEGVYRNGVADSHGRVVPGAGTGELRTLTGEASYRAEGHGPDYTVDYQLQFA